MKKISDYKDKYLLFNLPLYEKVTINITEIEKVSRDEYIDEYDTIPIYEEKYPKEFERLIEFLEYERVAYTYCNKCNKENTLNISKVNIDEKLNCNILYCISEDEFDDYNERASIYELKERINLLIKENKIFTKKAYCSYDNNHKFIFIYKLELDNDGKNLILQKIGQTPADFELHNKDIQNKYSKYKDYKKIKDDLNKALISHNSSFFVGGFLYLRRVLEKIITLKYESVKEKLSEENKKEFEGKCMKGKIDILKDYLPTYLTKNTCLYNVLSEGVHTLSEEKCEEYFETVEKSIYIIIEDLLKIQEENEEKIKKEKDLNRINSIRKQKK